MRERFQKEFESICKCSCGIELIINSTRNKSCIRCNYTISFDFYYIHIFETIGDTAITYDFENNSSYIKFNNLNNKISNKLTISEYLDLLSKYRLLK